MRFNATFTDVGSKAALPCPPEFLFEASSRRNRLGCQRPQRMLGQNLIKVCGGKLRGHSLTEGCGMNRLSGAHGRYHTGVVAALENVHKEHLPLSENGQVDGVAAEVSSA